jgi:glycosyltransferase involved in cell wall biosynthesis
MAAARPVVATDTGGCREAVSDGITGFLVPLHSPELVAQKVSWLLRHRAEASAIGLAGRRRVEDEFSLSRMIERFRALYDERAHERVGTVPVCTA